ncbi:UTP--glucose-1-phosphate uridylyltransferase [Abditibacteriota bacterium]|nr:UTP--glucose-1-phosphate uridylyltransferase [Abditibacteriota bacterium]
MQAIILAGGMGTRLRPLTYTLPKPMLPVAGRPALAHLVEALAEAGCREVIITTNYLAEIVENQLTRLSLPIPVRCVKEHKPLGTAGCVRNLYDELEERFLIIQGDAVADINYGAFWDFHAQSQADVSIAVMRVADTHEFGVCDVDSSGRIRRFQEKPRPEEAFSDLASSGIYVLEKKMFERVPDGVPFDFARQLFPDLMERHAKFFAWRMNGFWLDIGKSETYLQGNLKLIEGQSRVAPDATVAPDAVLVPPYSIGSNSKIGAGARIGPGAVIGARCVVGENASIEKSVVHDDVSIGPKARLEECVIASKSRVGRESHIETGAVIGESCDVGASAIVSNGTRLGPHTPLAPGAFLEGVLEPRSQKLSAIVRVLEAGARLEALLPDEREAYAVLAEGEELSARQIAETTALPLYRVLAALHALERAELLAVSSVHPPLYSVPRAQSSLPRRLLVVNPTEVGRETLRATFVANGHSVRTASDGIEAVEAVRDERFDAILMNADLPSLSGWDATRLIRGMANGRTVAVVMFSSRPLPEEQKRAQEVGATGVFAQTVLPEMVLPQVMELLER